MGRLVIFQDIFGKTIPAIRFAKRKNMDGFKRFLSRVHGCKLPFPNSATCRRGEQIL
jgi:hypothetical protein